MVHGEIPFKYDFFIRVNISMVGRKTEEQFIQESQNSHGDKYDYSLVNYKNGNTKVTIICPIHGEFQQLPCEHSKGRGCNACSYVERGNKKRKTW